jgi:outer membrane protein
MRTVRHLRRVIAWVGLAAMLPTAFAEDFLSLYREALAGNPMLRARQRMVERAQADADVARSRLYPQLSVQTSVSKNDYRDVLTDLRFDGNRTIWSARQALVDLPSRYRLRGAQIAVTQADREAEQFRAELFGQLVDHYLNALQSHDELNQLQSEQEAAERQVKRLRAMREREMAKVTDLTEAIAWTRQLATRQIDARNKADAARVRLRELTGRDPGELATLERQDFPDVPGSEAAWVDTVLTANALIASRQAAVDAGRLVADAARAEHLPQLTLALQRNQSNQDIDNSPRRDFTVDSVSVELRIPLFEGGRVSALTASAQAQLAIANEQLEASRREVERDTRLLFANAQANRARIDSTDAEVNALAETVRAQQRGYELGVVTVIQVLDARRRWLRSRVDQAKARYDYLRDLIGLKLRAGINEQDVAEFNRWLAPRAAASFTDMVEQLPAQ